MTSEAKKICLNCKHWGALYKGDLSRGHRFCQNRSVIIRSGTAYPTFRADFGCRFWKEKK